MQQLFQSGSLSRSALFPGCLLGILFLGSCSREKSYTPKEIPDLPRQGRCAEAIPLYEGMLDQPPGTTDLEDLSLIVAGGKGLWECRTMEGAHAKALEPITRAIDAAETLTVHHPRFLDARQRAELYRLRAETHEALGNLEDARTDLQQMQAIHDDLKRKAEQFHQLKQQLQAVPEDAG